MSLCLKLNCICERTETGNNSHRHSHSNCTLPPPVPLHTSGTLSLCLSVARLFLSFISFTSYTRVLFCIPPVCCLLSLVAFQLIIAKYSYACNCCTALGRALAERHTDADTDTDTDTWRRLQIEILSLNVNSAARICSVWLVNTSVYHSEYVPVSVSVCECVCVCFVSVRACELNVSNRCAKRQHPIPVPL